MSLQSRFNPMGDLYEKMGSEKYWDLCRSMSEYYIIMSLQDIYVPFEDAKRRAAAYRAAPYEVNNAAWQEFKKIERNMSEAISALEKLGYTITK